MKPPASLAGNSFWRSPLFRSPLFGAQVWGVLVGLFFLIPFGYLIIRGVDFGSSFFETLTEDKTLEALRKTLTLAISVALSTSILGVTLAWLTTRSDMYGRKILGILAPLPLAFPSYVGATALILGFAKGGLVEEVLTQIGIHSLPSINGFWGAWVALTLFTYPYVYLPTRAHFLTTSSGQEESAQLLGKGQVKIFFSIVLPQASRAISSGALLVFLYTISDFGAVALLRYNTLTLSIFSNRLANQSAAVAQAVLLVVVGIFLVSSERYLINRRIDRRNEGGTMTSGKAPKIIALRKWRWASSLGCSFFLFISLVGPLAVMGFWVIRGISNRGRVSGALAISLGDLLEPSLNTIYLGVITGFAAMVVVFPIARILIRHRSKIGGWVSILINSSFGLPGLIIALAMVYWALRSPASSFLGDWVYQTLPLLMGAYIIHFGAQAMGSAEIALTSVPKRIEEASQNLGATRLRRFFGIELPLMAPALGAGVGLVMLSTMKELPITLLLAPVDFSTLATDIWAATEERALAQAGLVSLILVVISGVLSWAVIFRSHKFLERA